MVANSDAHQKRKPLLHAMVSNPGLLGSRWNGLSREACSLIRGTLLSEDGEAMLICGIFLIKIGPVTPRFRHASLKAEPAKIGKRQASELQARVILSL